MTTLKTPTSDEIRERGDRALITELGVTGYVRYLQLIRPGSGDYTAEKQANPDTRTLDEIQAAIAEMNSETE